jgi:putative FmdB family regulatory protein
MPLYEYQCDACGHRFEAIRKFSDPPIETCPTCGSVVHKLQSAPAFQFKGSGWYITDYAKKDAPASIGESKPAAGEKTGAADTGNTKDTKPSESSKDTKDTKHTKEAKDTKETKPAGNS